MAEIVKKNSDFAVFQAIIREGLLKNRQMAATFALIAAFVTLSCVFEVYADNFKKDAMKHPEDITTVTAYICLYSIHWMFGWLHNRLFYSNLHFMKSLIYQHLMEKYLSCPHTSFGAVGTGKICSIIHKQADAVTFLLKNAVLELFYNVFYLVFFFVNLAFDVTISLGIKGVFAGLLVGAALHTCYMCYVLLDKKRRLIYTEHTNSHALLDIFRNVTVVKTFNNETSEIGRYHMLMRKQVSEGEAFYSFETSQNALFKSVLFICAVAPWIYTVVGSRRTAYGDPADKGAGGALLEQVGGTDLSLTAVREIVGYFNQFCSFKGKVTGLKNCVYVIFDKFVDSSATSVINVQPASTPNRTLKLPPSDLEIRFSNAAIYIDDMLIFNDFSLLVPFGRKIAITGRNGAGKSTIIKTLLGMLAHCGEITMGGMPLPELSTQALHNAISYVPQEPSLFNTTVIENLKYGRRISDEEVIKRCIECGVHQMFVNLEHGYQTVVGEGATSISGGQAQMINFMRAVIKNAPIFLLDEPTSNLDNYTSNLLLSIVFTMLRDKTVFFSTHNPAHLQRFDQILNINERRVGVYTYEEFVADPEHGNKL